MKSRSIRRAGSAALDLAYVAAGIFDGFFEFGLSPWDTAAGALLVTEAGGPPALCGIGRAPGGGTRLVRLIQGPGLFAGRCQLRRPREGGAAGRTAPL